jgi:hypothetical protein
VESPAGRRSALRGSGRGDAALYQGLKVPAGRDPVPRVEGRCADFAGTGKSANFVEGLFSEVELPLYGVLRRSPYSSKEAAIHHLIENTVFE